MSVEGLWSLFFKSNVGGEGGGVVVFETGRILGGDMSYYYLGDYKIDNGQVMGKVRVTHYQGEPSSIFGRASEFDLKIGGKLSGTQVGSTNTLTGEVIGRPNLVMGVLLTKRAELPD